jgi:hypothetical protein
MVAKSCTIKTMVETQTKTHGMITSYQLVLGISLAYPHYHVVGKL